MSDRQVGIRLGTTGKAEVKGDLTEIRDSGTAAYDAVGAASEAAAARAQRAFDRASTDIDAAARRQAAAAEKLAAIAPKTSAQLATETGVGTGYTGGSARDSANAIREQLAAQEKAEAQARSLREALDPLWAAQQRFDKEVKVAGDLLAAGVIDQDLYGKSLARSKSALSAAERELKSHGEAMGFNRTQTMIAQSAGIRFTDMLLAGQSPLRAFALESHKLGEVLAFDDGGVAGGLAKVRALLSPTVLAVGALTIATAAGVAAWYSYDNAMEKLTALAQGSGAALGLTGQQLEANAVKAANASTLSVAAAREIEEGYVKLGGIGGSVLAGLTALTENFAAATGQEAKTATAELGRAFQDPIRGAEELAAKYGALTQAQVDRIAKLVEEGKREEAQIEILHAMEGAFDGAADHANILTRAIRGIGNAASDSYELIGRMIDRVVSGAPLMERINSLMAEKAARAAGGGHEALGARLGLPGFGTGVSASDADLDRQLNEAIGQARTEAARSRQATANARGAAARSVADGLSGRNQLDDYRSKLSILNAVPASQRTKDETAAIEAYGHAIDTFIPKQEKAVRLAQLDERAKTAKTAASKREIAEERSRIETAGEVVTAAEAQAMATAKGGSAAAGAKVHHDRHAESLARAAASMDVAARSNLDLADAYLKGGSAALEGEARVKAATDATKRGTDVEAQVRRQLNLNVAEGAVAGAKAVAVLREETAARVATNDNLAGNVITAAGMNQQLSDEAALRPLLKLQAIAQGDALARLTTIINAYKAALADAHATEAETLVQSDGDANARKRIEAAIAAQYAGDTTGAGEQALQRRRSQWRAQDNHLSDGQANRLSEDDQATLASTRASGAAGASKLQGAALAEQNAMLGLQISLVGKSANAQARATAQLQLQQSLTKTLGEHYGEFAPAILAAADANEVAKQKLAALTAGADEFRRIGESAVDTIFDPQNWSNWGDLGHKVIQSLEQDLLRLAVLNPLKNALFGEALPTLGGLGHIFGHAAGTENFGGGLTWLAENGPELVSLPAGAKVSSAASTRQLLGANDNGQRVQVEFLGFSDLFNVRVSQIAAPIAMASGNAAASAGAGMALKRGVQSAGRQLR